MYIQFKCFTIDPDSVTKSCCVIKPLDERLEELLPSPLLANRISLQKVQKTVKTLVKLLLYL